MTTCKSACKQHNLLIVIYSSIPVRSTRIPLGSNPEGDFCVILFCTFGEGINESADEDNRGSRSSDRP